MTRFWSFLLPVMMLATTASAAHAEQAGGACPPAKDASVLVMHLPIPGGATGRALQLHAQPSRIASIAAEAHAWTLVLSHFMPRSLRDLDGNVEVVRGGYDGTVVVAEDLTCVVVPN